MLRRYAHIATLTVLVFSLTLGLTACKKKSGGKGKASAMAGDEMDSDDEMDPDQPPAMPVELDGDNMAPGDMDPEDLDMAGPDPTLPTAGQATARMILIPWKGADNLADEITRTKAEAKALAEKVHQEALTATSEANFTKLVKKYSMGPTKDNGGKVGPFGPKDVPAYIATAVFALKQGGVSKIVETKSGYHIFMRTK